MDAIDNHVAPQDLSRAERRRLLRRSALRAALVAVVLVGLYYVLPLRALSGVPVAISLVTGLLIFAGIVTWQVFAIVRAPYPGVRAVEGLALIVPLFLVTFASLYVVMAQDDPLSFSSHSLTRTDALYFTVTVFASVGFGDITATSQGARIVVMIQMVWDLVLLGLGVRLLIGAVNVGRRRRGLDPPIQPEGEAGDSEPGHERDPGNSN